MPHISSADIAYKITAPDGTALWQGMAIAGQIFLVENKETSATIGAGEAVRLSAATLVLSHFNLGATANPPVQVLGGLRVSAATNVNWLGVAIEPIPVGKLGRVIGTGSLCGVKCVSGGGTNTVNDQVIGTTTAGAVTAIAPFAIPAILAQTAGAAGTQATVAIAAIAAANGGTVLGSVVSISGVAGPPTDMNSATALGVYIKGSY